MPTLTPNLILPRCPHCSIANPNLAAVWQTETNNHHGSRLRRWLVYKCGSCGGLVPAAASQFGAEVLEYFPTAQSVKDDIPEKPRNLLQQALDSLHAPSGAVMLAASAVDSMLKLKGYMDGSLYSRIEKAAADHVITSDMATWAHDVRLDANDQRHADDGAPLPSEDDAQRAVDFATALAEFMFVLPSRVQKGIRPKG